MQNIDNHILRYANCWEDADILLEGMSVEAGDRVLSIGSAGDNCFSLLTADASKVVAVDMNRTQLHLIALKRAAFRALEYEEFLAFLGFDRSEQRRQLYLKVREYLEPDAGAFWDAHPGRIDAGIINGGKFERYFSMFRKRILPLVHSDEKVKQLFYPRDSAAQARFYDEKWNTFRWRTLFRLFFSRRVMGLLGRDPAFLEQVEEAVGPAILRRAAAHLSTQSCSANYYLGYILRGSFFNGLPHYARKEHFEIIKARLDRLDLHHGTIETVFDRYSSFDAFNLSDIFEYMPQNQFESIARTLVKHGNPGARYAYWNLLVPRILSAVDRELESQPEHSRALSNRDKCFFYQGFFIDIKNQ